MILSWVKNAKKNGRFVIGVVGRIEFKHKQQDKFIDYFSNSTIFSKSSVVFIGGGSDEDNLRDIISKNYNINCFGPLKATGIPEIFSQIDLLVICSSFEGVPLVMLEALSSGLRVASFYYESIEDYENVVDFADHQNFDYLMTVIEDIINHPSSKNKEHLEYVHPNREQITAVNDQIVILLNRNS
jgi:hypothetical protein